mmetsp:Transcript_16949/g.41290  ORF Transcript_16949/g.41290 Transcript_16949/m.41290 type:complete len:248 (-) Transcript_16949:514-1257(-)
MSSDSQKCHQDARFTCNICFDAVVEPVVPRCGHLFCWPCLYRWLEPGMQPDERASLGLLPSASTNSSRCMCPVCKSPCSTHTLVPIYVRSDEPIQGNSGGQEVSRSENLTSEVSTQNRSSTTDPLHRDNAEDEEATSPSVPDDSNLGLRQRRVPSRPAASSPSPQSPNHDSRRNNNLLMTQSPNSHRASLSHGIMLTFQQATSSSVPPLHRRIGDVAELDAHPNATEYLSRLLIMLTSFVILCLLLL